jgi:hypothetical protein
MKHSQTVLGTAQCWSGTVHLPHTGSAPQQSPLCQMCLTPWSLQIDKAGERLCPELGTQPLVQRSPSLQAKACVRFDPWPSGLVPPPHCELNFEHEGLERDLLVRLGKLQAGHVQNSAADYLSIKRNTQTVDIEQVTTSSAWCNFGSGKD